MLIVVPEGGLVDAAEFDHWYAAAYPRLVAQLTALVGNRAEAQDCVQEAFVRAWDRKPTLESVGEQDAWIRTTAYRLAVSRWRRLRRGRELTAQGLRAPRDPLADSETRLDLLDVLQRLPLDQRRVIVLHYFADRSVAQIAAEIGVPEGTVKSRLHRARAGLAGVSEGSLR